jgi:ketosteroid isomerase-like protein
MTDPLTTDRAFFAALLAADAQGLERLLGDDFLLIDVMTGSEIPKPALVEVVGSGQLRFDTIAAGEPHLRRYGSAAVVTGQTEMHGQYAGAPWTARSRYTHVFVEHDGAWRLVAAQGTPIAQAT